MNRLTLSNPHLACLDWDRVVAVHRADMFGEAAVYIILDTGIEFEIDFTYGQAVQELCRAQEARRKRERQR